MTMSNNEEEHISLALKVGTALALLINFGITILNGLYKSEIGPELFGYVLGGALFYLVPLGISLCFKNMRNPYGVTRVLFYSSLFFIFTNCSGLLQNMGEINQKAEIYGHAFDIQFPIQDQLELVHDGPHESVPGAYFRAASTSDGSKLYTVTVFRTNRRYNTLEKMVPGFEKGIPTSYVRFLQ